MAKTKLTSGNREQIRKDLKIMKAYLKGKPIEVVYWINCKPTWMPMRIDEHLLFSHYDYRVAKKK